MAREVELKTITHNGNRTPPLTVCFAIGDAEHTVAVDAGQVQTFTAFQRVVANRLGLFVRHYEAERTGRRGHGKEVWADEVEKAFQQGRKSDGNCDK